VHDGLGILMALGAVVLPLALAWGLLARWLRPREAPAPNRRKNRA
jgi:hypothetical protein